MYTLYKASQPGANQHRHGSFLPAATTMISPGLIKHQLRRLERMKASLALPSFGVERGAREGENTPIEARELSKDVASGNAAE